MRNIGYCSSLKISIIPAQLNQMEIPIAFIIGLDGTIAIILNLNNTIGHAMV